jgi:hypothetical protein
MCLGPNKLLKVRRHVSSLIYGESLGKGNNYKYYFPNYSNKGTYKHLLHRYVEFLRCLGTQLTN